MYISLFNFYSFLHLFLVFFLYSVTVVYSCFVDGPALPFLAGTFPVN